MDTSTTTTKNTNMLFTEVTDGDGHHFIIPTALTESWQEWLESEQVELGEYPEWVDGPFSGRVTFNEYKIN